MATGVSLSAIHAIAAANKNFMTMTEIKVDIQFITHLHDYWVFPHFKHCQLGDPVTRDFSGYQGHLMIVWYFIMNEDLCICENGEWRAKAAFKSLLVSSIQQN